ncbi:MAG: adenine-specific methyltransferase EcoRI family protein [Ignavibacteriales bacterium]|nr:adenine-specific methyltransferase EcoRI family protein [Ignavibacteriales bacterium]
MARKGSIKNLQKARNEKNDEFYTILSDIEKELKHYKKHFKNKVVFCNCDDPRVSNFFHYFSYNYEQLGLKKLITTCYKNQNADLFSEHKSEKAIYLEYTGDKNRNNVPDPEEIGIKYLNGDGDFRSKESIELLKQSDIVVTNPPFSLFREYVTQLIEYKKKFLIIGTWNAISYKEIFKLIKENKVWLGIHSNRNFSGFIVPKHYPLSGTEARIDENGNRIVSSNNTCWFTNLDISKRHEELILYKKYNKTEYPFYENYDAINVDVTKDIPFDYKGAMGVPITFMDKYNPNQFEIIALGIVGSINFSSNKKMEILNKQGKPTGKYTVNAKGTLYRLYNPKTDKTPAFKDCKTGKLYSSIYARVIIKSKKI